jgi:uncharacterized membrane protein YhaH (DUF805 family)
MGLMFQPYRKYFDFKGRARRSEYWLFHLMLFVAILVAAPAIAIGGSLLLPKVQYGLWILPIFLAFSAIPWLALNVRRLHGIDKTGWLILLAFIPGVGWLILLVFHLPDGTPGPNGYGRDPKGRGGREQPLAFGAAT